MKVLFLSHFYPKCRRDEYMKNSKVGLAAAADAHQYAIALGLNTICEDFEVINVPALFYWPNRYCKRRINSELILENNLVIHNVGYDLLAEYTFISQYKETKKALAEIISKTDDKIYIIVYGIRAQAMRAAFDLQSSYPNKIKVANIIPDLPEDVNTHGRLKSLLLTLLRYPYQKPVSYYFPKFDSFILLTEYMREVIPTNKDNYIISEGIYEETVTKRPPHQEDTHSFTIFYGGMLYEKFGIMNLVKAFHSLPNSDMRLQLCGYGDCIDKVIEVAKTDNRIQYFGVVSRDDVLNYQSKASLLVNPRIPDGNSYTRYSFPSKTLEYFASGTPTLIYQLDGIPSEYYKYCYNLDSAHTGVEDLARKILEIYNEPVNKRLSLGAKARNFILERKNPIVACGEIYNLLIKTMENNG